MGKSKDDKAAKQANNAFNAFQVAVQTETIRKEMKHYKIHENYVPARMTNNWVLADKPNNIDIHTKIDTEDILPVSKREEHGIVNRDPFDPAFSTHHQVTMSQDYGWFSRPLMNDTCTMFRHPRVVTEITLLYGPSDRKLKLDKKK
ncbi:hypothetical protein HDU98_009689 [Podochytrium sp. JEL0797]|nr:hypothetical protein HDU98_009689 [Podochytrium sp. JEL0797]